MLYTHSTLYAVLLGFEIAVALVFVVLIAASRAADRVTEESELRRAAKRMTAAELARNLNARDAELFPASEAATACHSSDPGTMAASTPTDGRPSARG